jgi:predicted phosphoribosyltransferase
MVKALNLAAIAAFASLCACTTTPKGSFCALAEAHRPANVDALTDAEVADLLKHNAKGAALCGWKP